MNHAFVRFVSRLLIASLACLPFQARAELIGTNQAVLCRAGAAGAREPRQRSCRPTASRPTRRGRAWRR